MRAYAEAYRIWNDPERTKRGGELPDTEMMRLVKLNDFRRTHGREPVIADG